MLAVGLTVSLGLQTLIIAAGNVKLVPLTGHHLPVRELRRLEPARLLRGGRPAAGDQPSVGRRRADGGARAVIATNVRRLSLYLVLAFASVSGALVWWQVLDAQQLAARPDNPQVIAAHRSLPRGSIFDARGRLLASSQVVDGVSTPHLHRPGLHPRHRLCQPALRGDRGRARLGRPAHRAGRSEPAARPARTTSSPASPTSTT